MTDSALFQPGRSKVALTGAAGPSLYGSVVAFGRPGAGGADVAEQGASPDRLWCEHGWALGGWAVGAVVALVLVASGVVQLLG